MIIGLSVFAGLGFGGGFGGGMQQDFSGDMVCISCYLLFSFPTVKVTDLSSPVFIFWGPCLALKIINYIWLNEMKAVKRSNKPLVIRALST